MNWMNIVWPMVGAACVTLALMNPRIAMVANFVAPVPAIRQAVAIERVQTWGGASFTHAKFVIRKKDPGDALIEGIRQAAWRSSQHKPFNQEQSF